MTSTKQRARIVPYNPNNKLITRAEIETLLNNVTGIPLSVHFLASYQTAFVHDNMKGRKFAPGCPLVFDQSYEVMELIGDAWVNAFVVEYLYHRYPEADEGELSQLRSKIVRTEGLARLARHLNLGRYVVLDRKLEDNGGREQDDILEDVFEAFCAAVREDQGLAVLNLFLKNIIETVIDVDLLRQRQDNFKRLLIKAFAQRNLGRPEYHSMLLPEQLRGKYKFFSGVKYVHAMSVGTQTTEPAKLDADLLDVVPHECQFLAFGYGQNRKQAEARAAQWAVDRMNA